MLFVIVVLVDARINDWTNANGVGMPPSSIIVIVALLAVGVLCFGVHDGFSASTVRSFISIALLDIDRVHASYWSYFALLLKRLIE